MPHHSGHDFVPTTHHDTYPAIDPAKADLAGKVVVITGASRGIGKTIAVAFAQAGASGLVLLVRGDTTAVEAACTAAPRPGQDLKVLALAVDITDTAQVAAAAQKAKATFGRVDIVVNNAGYMSPIRSLVDSDPAEWWQDWEVNVRGPYNVARAFIPLLLECGGDKIILNVSSIVAQGVVPGFSSYQSSKFALLRVTESIVADYGAQGILSFAIHPCGTPTDMNVDVSPEVKKLLIDTPELAAHTIVWLVRERREWLSGRYISCEWDVDELSAKKDEIVEGDKLKFRMVV